MRMRRRQELALVAGLVVTLPACSQAQQWNPPSPDLLARAEAILDQVPVIDGHNDLPSEVLQRSGGDLNGVDIAEPQPEIHTDLARLRAGRVGGQFWSAYVTTDSMEGAALRHALREIDMVHRLAARYPELEFARTAADIERIQGEGRIASLIGLEGGHAIEHTLAAVRMFADLGVRYMTLTHSATHDWADASTDDPVHGGLSPFGVEVVREMNRVGIFVDLSHVAPSTMHDALDVVTAPVIFSHSSARALVDHPRNVPDDVLRRIPENGGVVMVTFVPGFISNDVMAYGDRRSEARDRFHAQGRSGMALREAMEAWEAENPAPRASVADVADHIDHVREIAGIDHIGIGSDFDGISSTPVGLEDVSTFPVLFAELLRRGYSEEDLHKIAGLNLLRAMRGMERARGGTR